MLFVISSIQNLMPVQDKLSEDHYNLLPFLHFLNFTSFWPSIFKVIKYSFPTNAF